MPMRAVVVGSRGLPSRRQLCANSGRVFVTIRPLPFLFSTHQRNHCLLYCTEAHNMAAHFAWQWLLGAEGEEHGSARVPLSALTAPAHTAAFVAMCLCLYILGYVHATVRLPVAVVAVWLVALQRYARRSALKESMAAGEGGGEVQPASIPEDQRPTWLLYPDAERAQFTNIAIHAVWGYVSFDMSHRVRAMLNGVLNDRKPALLQRLTISELALGSLPPSIVAVKAYRPSLREFMLDVHVRFVGDPRVTVEVCLAHTPAAAALHYSLADVEVEGTVRIRAAPLCALPPYAASVHVSFLHTPRIDFDLVAARMNLMSVPPLRAVLLRALRGAARAAMLFPAEITIPILPQDAPEVRRAVEALEHMRRELGLREPVVVGASEDIHRVAAAEEAAQAAADAETAGRAKLPHEQYEPQDSIARHPGPAASTSTAGAAEPAADGHAAAGDGDADEAEGEAEGHAGMLAKAASRAMPFVNRVVSRSGLVAASLLPCAPGHAVMDAAEAVRKATVHGLSAVSGAAETDEGAAHIPATSPVAITAASATTHSAVSAAGEQAVTPRTAAARAADGSRGGRVSPPRRIRGSELEQVALGEQVPVQPLSPMATPSVAVDAAAGPATTTTTAARTRTWGGSAAGAAAVASSHGTGGGGGVATGTGAASPTLVAQSVPPRSPSPPAVASQHGEAVGEEAESESRGAAHTTHTAAQPQPQPQTQAQARAGAVANIQGHTRTPPRSPARSTTASTTASATGSAAGASATIPLPLRVRGASHSSLVQLPMLAALVPQREGGATAALLAAGASGGASSRGSRSGSSSSTSGADRTDAAAAGVHYL